MKLHPRTLPVQSATAELKQRILDFADEHGLTDIEMVRALAEAQSIFTTSLLRAERHPGNPDRKADEA